MGLHYEISRFLKRVFSSQETLVARRLDLHAYLGIAIDKATAPPMTPAQNLDPTSPAMKHPFTRPEAEHVTLLHWIYDLQKHTWFLNEKSIRYEALVTTILTQTSRKRKLYDLGQIVHTSWVNLMLHLSLVIAQQNAESQTKTSNELGKLVVATGLVDIVSGTPHLPNLI